MDKIYENLLKGVKLQIEEGCWVDSIDDINDDYEYYFSIATDGDIFQFYCKQFTFETPLDGNIWKIFWEIYKGIPVNDEDLTVDRFIHFPIGTYTDDIWDWFEWYFSIKLNDQINK